MLSFRDLSYNNFTKSSATSCQQLNLTFCLKRNLPCAGNPQYDSLFINCGGSEGDFDGNHYVGDLQENGISNFVLRNAGQWAYSSTGVYMGDVHADYTASNTYSLNINGPEYYRTALLSPLSLSYYGLCMKNGDYKVELHFAEIMFFLMTRLLKVLEGAYLMFQFKNHVHVVSANKIGEGGFGPVFKGVLSDGDVIAVKQLSSKSKQGNREFVNEIGMISALQHPNLVKLYGCCIEGKQLLLIYEYMENNCLGRALFGHQEQKLHLDWPTRMKICLGIAKGLAYLHEESTLKIVHRDIKATNTRRNLAKLEIYRKFTNTLAVSVLLSIAWIGNAFVKSAV
ncbi:probable LRR receptor-like serine/threonine-protein kinase At1g53440 [Lathyrus oleraceus]|uniref:probable LRR receptor-like serine/threonine-protein kinase At1g53440 n=1 Tax=Pisum sativum TaxID=3888 RepID=UPI0021D19BA3|nr:probable LRR receptor-like serine/threonine-protein kinase At1g53440 [Pisum sativum]